MAGRVARISPGVLYPAGQCKGGEIMIIEPDAERKFDRIHFDRLVSLEFVNNSYDHCPVENLSLSGMFVTGDFSLQVNEICLINLVQTGMSTDMALQASARVVRKDDRGIAVEFTSMPYDSYLFLQATLLCESGEKLTGLHESPENYPFEITYRPPSYPKTNSSFH
ncbi:MAG TPA: PilZ domain-containing protein [Desulfobacteraceae bacterium]|nr:PilZ domain-containing protein [Desulfobacteraceae bacterium]